MRLLHHADGGFYQIPHHGFHIPAHVAHLGIFGGFYLNEGGVDQLGQAAGDFGFAHAGGAHHQNVFRGDLLLHFRIQLAAAPAVAQGDSHGSFGLVLADDIAVELLDDLPGFEVHTLHAYTSSTRIWSLVYTQMPEAMRSAFSAISRAGRSVFSSSARAAASA